MSKASIHANNFNLIRLLAAAQVLAVHSLNHNGISGWGAEIFKATPGVPIFFFISGYLISSAYVRTRESGLMEFFRNRVLRIFPALVACVLLSTMMVLLTGYLSTQSFSIPQFLLWITGQMTFVQFYNPDFMRGFGVGVINGALWTITVELQFYLLTPILIWLMTRKRWIAALLFASSLAANLFLAWFAGDRSFAEKLLSVSFLPWVYMFMIGMFLALKPLRAASLKQPRGVLILTVLYIASIFAIGGFELNAQNSINPLSFVLLAALIFKLAHVKIAGASEIQAFIRRNDFSYGIYLYHMPLINLTLFLGLTPIYGIATAAVCAICLATLSWYLIEKPALKRKH